MIEIIVDSNNDELKLNKDNEVTYSFSTKKMSIIDILLEIMNFLDIDDTKLTWIDEDTVTTKGEW